MRPLRLEMKGFGPFRTTTTIDFTDLDLVALVGPTGSGKSTIIDAVTFALYGSVARYHDNRMVAPVISSLEREARVQLDFQLGDEEYRVARVVRRTANGATTKEARLEHGDEVLSGSAKDLTDKVRTLIGLDVDQFNKTVVLPQGDFANFLRQTAGERQELLRRLFDLEIYSRMGHRARARAKEARNRAMVIEERLADGPEVSPERIKELKRRVKALAKVRADVAAAVDDLEATDRRRDATTTDRDRAATEIELLDALVRPDGVDQIVEERAGAQAALVAAEGEIAAARGVVAEARSAVADGPDGPTCRRLLDKRDELERGEADLGDARRSAGEATEAANAADAAARTVRAELEQLTEAIGSARASRAEAQATAEAGPQPSRLEAWLRAAGERDEQVERGEAAEVRRSESETGLTQATEALRRARQVLDDASMLEAAARQAAGASGLIAALHVGDPCPVCRQVVAEIPDHDVDAELARATAEVTAARQAVEAAEQAERAADREHATAVAALGAVGDRLAELDEQLTGAPDRAQLERDLALAEQLAQAVEVAEAAVDAAEAAERDARQDVRHRTTLEAAEQAGRARAAADEKVTILSERVAALAGELASAPDRDALTAEVARAEELAAAVTEAETRLQDAEQAETEARRLVAAADEASDEAQRSFDRARDLVHRLGPPAADQSTVAERWTVLIDWAESASTERVTEVAAAETLLVELTAELERRRAGIVAMVEPWLPEPTRESFGDQLTRAEEATRSELAQADKDLVQQGADREAVAALTEEAQVADELGRLLDARRFEAWLLAEAVTDLVDRATDRLLELSGGQYSLVADGTDFKVRDHRNADELREARTLSGGETFLTSLALALALAESVAELATGGSPKLDSIFLDEGFGTLDPETLDAVASAIEELGATGRMVGIVTHIRDLAERMPVRLEVTKETTTSVVERVEV
jgi:exonuclease SbcC